MISDLKRSGEWKINLTMKMNFMSRKDSNEKCLMHSKSYHEEIITTFDTEEITEELFHLDFLRYQVGLEQSMKGSELHLVSFFFIAHVLRYEQFLWTGNVKKVAHGWF